MKNLLIIGLSLLVCACYPIKGTLFVASPLDLKLNNGRLLSIEPGEHKTALSFGRDQVTLRVETQDKKYRIKFTLPEGKELPAENGTFSLLGEEMGQDFDIEGFVRTQYAVSGQYRDREYCTYTELRYVCRGRGANQRCGYEDVKRRGFQDVEYHYEETKTHMQAEFIEDNEVITQFSGDRHVSQKIYDYKTRCF